MLIQLQRERHSREAKWRCLEMWHLSWCQMIQRNSFRHLGLQKDLLKDSIGWIVIDRWTRKNLPNKLHNYMEWSILQKSVLGISGKVSNKHYIICFKIVWPKCGNLQISTLDLLHKTSVEMVKNRISREVINMVWWRRASMQTNLLEGLGGINE